MAWERQQGVNNRLFTCHRFHDHHVKFYIIVYFNITYLKARILHIMNNLEHTQYVPTKTLLKPVIGGLVIMPISLTLWIFGTIRSNYLSADDVSDSSPIRWFIATLVPAIISHRGLKKKSLSLSGAILGKDYKNYKFLFFLPGCWSICLVRPSEMEGVFRAFKHKLVYVCMYICAHRYICTYA